MFRTLRVAFLLAGTAFVNFGRTNARATQPQPKRVGIGLGDSQLEDLPLPTAGAKPVGGVQTTPTAKDDHAPGQAEPRKGEFIFAPIPISNQAIGIGLVAVAAYVFPSKSGRASHPSTLALAGIYTSTKTYGLGLGRNIFLKNDGYRLTFLVGGARARYQFFGIGSDSGRAGKSFWLSQHGHALLLRGMKRLKWDIFVGPRFSQRQIKAGEEISSGDFFPNLPQFLPIQPQLNLAITSAGFGMRVERDKRDDMFYPHNGSRIDGRADFFGPYVGSTFTFQSYQFEANRYLPFGKRQVLALRGIGCIVTGDRVPFFELCQFGMMGDLRATNSADIVTGQCSRRRQNGVSPFGDGLGPLCLVVSERLRRNGVGTTRKTCYPVRDQGCGITSRSRGELISGSIRRTAKPADPGSWV